MKKYKNYSIAPESKYIVWLNNIEKPRLINRAINFIMGVPAVANQLNKVAILEFIPDSQIVKNGRVVGNILKFTPRVIKNATPNDMQSARTYVSVLVGKLGFDVRFSNDGTDVYVPLHSGKNITVLQNVGHMLNFQPTKSITQEIINKIRQNNIAR